MLISCTYCLDWTGLAAIERLRLQDPGKVERCSAAAGLSLGEYTALVFAGAMSFEDGLKVCIFGFCIVHLNERYADVLLQCAFEPRGRQCQS